MKCRVSKSVISGDIACPASKSYTHRAVFLAALAGHSRVDNVLFSADTCATIEACRNFGAGVIRDGSSLRIGEPIKTDHLVHEVDAANSGTTIRIAAGIAGLFERQITLTGDQSLQKRPMQPLLDALEGAGAKCVSRNGMPPVGVTGRIVGGDVAIRGDVSSQFVSALLICAPLARDGMNLSIRGNLVSKPYLDATIAAMGKFGVHVQTLVPYGRYGVRPQAYRPAVFSVPADSSSLALLLSAAVLNGRNVSITGTVGNMPQGDKVFADMLGRMGARVQIGNDRISISAPAKLAGGSFDLGNSPDLLPALAILALKSSEPITIFNVRHARLKETDRISIMCRELSKVGIPVRESDDGMVLEPTQTYRNAELDPEKDHRLFMAFCIAGMFIGGCMVKDPESVAVSYPGFVEEMNRMGAAIAMV